MKYPFIHLCLRVENLEKSIKFYEEALGYEVVRHDDFPEDKFTLVFLRDHESGIDIELTYNYEHGPYEIGNGYSHFAVRVDDAEASFAKHKQMGVTVNEAPYSSPGGNSLIYFIRDPDGYDVEIIGNKK